jgi:hypothetical protein
MRTVEAVKISLLVWGTLFAAAIAGGVYAGFSGNPNPAEQFLRNNFVLNLALGWGSLWLVSKLLNVSEDDRKVIGGLIALLAILAFLLPGLGVLWLLGLLGWRGIRRLVTGRGTPARNIEAERRARDAELDRLAGIQEFDSLAAQDLRP